MSKSLNNYIGITDAPNDMFGKVMSIPDDLMWRYYDLLSFKPLDQVNELKQQIEQGANPRDAKVLLAKELIARFHDEDAANKAEQDFIQRFSKNAIPDDIDEVTVTAPDEEGVRIANLLKDAGLVASTSNAMQLIKQGGVKVDGKDKVTDTRLVVAKGTTAVYQVGKRKFAKVTVA
jgi:tyrosyl-tRNA synthetase